VSAALAFLRTLAVVRLARIAIGVIFLAAALGKIADLGAFAMQLHNYRMVPLWSEHLIAMILPWIELLAGLGLVFGVRPRSGAVVVLALMLVFTVAVGSAWARGLDFQCGCFGKASAATIGARKFLENVGFTLLAALATLRPRG
jgi:uncharacterized membrane protein YphA (DoxX/SURF4 family)